MPTIQQAAKVNLAHMQYGWLHDLKMLQEIVHSYADQLTPEETKFLWGVINRLQELMGKEWPKAKAKAAKAGK